MHTLFTLISFSNKLLFSTCNKESLQLTAIQQAATDTQKRITHTTFKPTTTGLPQNREHSYNHTWQSPPGATLLITLRGEEIEGEGIGRGWGV